MARDDGLVDVWDLTDSSYRPKQQLLAVGDKVGNLHVFDVPRNLWRSATNEKSMMEAFLVREVSRVQYVAERLKIRREEDAAAGDADEKAGGEAGGAAGVAEAAQAAAASEEVDMTK